LSTKHGEGLKREYASTRRHELYDDNEYDFRIVRITDSALVDPTTNEPTGATLVELNRDPDTPLVGEEMEIVGFGLTVEGHSEMSQDLYDVTVNVVGIETCRAQYGAFIMADTMVCGGVEGGGKDSCQVSSALSELARMPYNNANPS
jgi:trypsin